MSAQVRVENVSVRKLAAVQRQVRIGEVASSWRPALDRVWEVLRKNPGLRADGHNIFLYQHPENRQLPMKVAFGVEVTREFPPSGQVALVETPAGRVASALHLGPYDQMKSAHKEDYMKRMWGCVFVVCVFAYFSWAQNVPGDVAADKEDVQKLFVTLHLREMMQNMMMTSMQQQKQLTRDTLKEKVPGITNEELNRIDAVVDDLVKTIDVNGILDDMIPVYQRHLSKQDVDAMLAFYNTPTGQKLLREQPAMMAEGMQAMQPRMKKMMSDVMDKVEQIARQESGKTDAPVK